MSIFGQKLRPTEAAQHRTEANTAQESEKKRILAPELDHPGWKEQVQREARKRITDFASARR